MTSINVCEHCDKSFGENCNLQRHINTVHLKQQNFHCSYCDKSFGLKEYLQKHTNTVHLKLKNFQCSYCDKLFGGKSNLNRHIKTKHLKQQNHTCTYCHKSFGENTNLQRHIKTVHLKQCVYSCNNCHESFGEKCNLQRHINNIHLNPKPKNMSRGEKAVKDVLDNYEYEYIQEKTFEDLKGFTGRNLRYDFAIVIDSDEEDYLLIEYDGKQHYKPVRWQSNQSDEEVTRKFKQLKRYDRIKNKYAKLHDYPLLRIRYDQKHHVKELIEQFLKDYTNTFN